MSDVHVRVRACGEDYAFPVDAVREVGELTGVTPVPGAGADVLGVLNLRGQVLPVIDLGVVLELSRQGAPQRMIVVESARGIAGIAVDELVDVGPLAALTESADSPYLDGAVIDNGALIAAVSVDAVVSAVAAGARR